jgi:hypothetical protein
MVGDCRRSFGTPSLSDGGERTAIRRLEKTEEPDGTWRHARVFLHPATNAEGYAPIVIEANGAEEVRVIAEWLGAVE